MNKTLLAIGLAVIFGIASYIFHKRMEKTDEVFGSDFSLTFLFLGGCLVMLATAITPYLTCLR